MAPTNPEAPRLALHPPSGEMRELPHPDAVSFDANGVARRRDGTFAPKQSGNPGGVTDRRLRVRKFRAYLEERGGEIEMTDRHGRTRLEILGDLIWTDALGGDPIAQRFLLDRISPVSGPLVPKSDREGERIFVIRDYTGGLRDAAGGDGSSGRPHHELIEINAADVRSADPSPAAPPLSTDGDLLEGEPMGDVPENAAQAAAEAAQARVKSEPDPTVPSAPTMPSRRQPRRPTSRDSDAYFDHLVEQSEREQSQRAVDSDEPEPVTSRIRAIRWGTPQNHSHEENEES